MKRAFFLRAGVLLLLLLPAAAPLPSMAALQDDSWCVDPGAQDISFAECRFLEALYRSSTLNAPWRRADGWLASAAVCGTETTPPWYGVRCSESGTAVTALDLSSNNLNGVLTFPLSREELAALEALAAIDLTDNALSGPLPGALGELRGLRELSLGGNQFQGALPAALGRLSRLTWLDLGDNMLSGSIPAALGELRALRTLWLDGNQLVGALPRDLCALPLTSAGLDYNRLDLFATDPGWGCDALFPGWTQTQTVPPAGVSAEMLPGHSGRGADELLYTVRVTWLPINYVEDGGRYEVYACRPALSGGCSAARKLGQTADKRAEELAVVVDENPLNLRYLVRTTSEAHAGNQSALASAAGKPVAARPPGAGTAVPIEPTPPMTFLYVAPLALLLLVVLLLLGIRARAQRAG